MPRNKLTLDQVKDILTIHKDVSGRQLSKMYGLSHATVSQIRAGRTWKNEIEWLAILEPDKFGHLVKREESNKMSQP